MASDEPPTSQSAGSAAPCDNSRADFVGYRRRVKIDPKPGRVSAWLEDDFHHFGVELVHDGHTVQSVATHAPRYPWSTCPAAGTLLAARFKGAALASFGAGEDQNQHCTHIYDLAMAAARHALDDKPTVYDISLADDRGEGACAELRVDGALTLRWIMGPAGGRDGVPGGDHKAFGEWTRGLGPDLKEAGLMFRRGVMVAGGRRLDLKSYKTASEIGAKGACYTFQPERAVQSKRILGAIRDFSHTPDAPLSGET